MKKLSLIFVLVLSLMLFSACNGEENQDDNSNVSNNSSNNEVEQIEEKYDEIQYEIYPDEEKGSKFILARSGEHWGLLDGNQNEILSPKKYELDKIYLNTYEEIWPIIVVEKQGLLGAIDYYGNIVIEPQYKDIKMFIYDNANMIYCSNGEDWQSYKINYSEYTDVFNYKDLKVEKDKVFTNSEIEKMM